LDVYQSLGNDKRRAALVEAKAETSASV